MIDKQLATDILTAALSTGGSFAEIFLEHTVKNGITLTNGQLEHAVSGVDYGLGIRIFHGNNGVYAYTNDTSRDNLIKMATETAQTIGQEGFVKPSSFIKKEIQSNHNILILPDNISKKRIVDCLRLASKASYDQGSLITQTSGSYGDVVQDILIVNSEGLWVTDRRVRTRVRVTAVATEMEKQTGSMSPGAQKGGEFLDELDMEALGKDSAVIALTMLKAELCPSGKMPVIIDNGFGGVIFHEACGHGLEATAVAKGASVFTGKLGQQIASPLVTAIDDGTLPNEWGSINMDDEGSQSRRNILIEKGILKTYMVDRLNGMKMGCEPTGSSRRESYKYAPTSRMTNTYIAAGPHKPGDIIADTEYGLYAKKMGGGSVQPATGEFNFAVLEGYMVEKGKITRPVRGATLIGKGAEVLMKIDRVADNLELAQGMCGSESGSVPTNVGQPMIRVKELTVGGR